MRPSSRDRSLADAALAACELEHLANRPVDGLSGGEQKRVALARAFAQTPRIMLLDEPTAFLDVRHQVTLFERLAAAARTDKLTSIVASHDLQLAAAYASRIVLMKAGRVLAQGTVEEVLTPARLTEAFDWPVDVGRVEPSGSRVFVPGRA